VSETPAQRADRVDRMLESCRGRGTVRMSHLESVRNELRAVANEYEDLEAQLKLQVGALPLDPFGEWLDHQMREQHLSVAALAVRANHVLAGRDIAQWRAGRDSPNATEAFILANALGVSVIDALNFAGHGHMVVAIVEENDELRAANQPAIGST
jgi:hypothetical protein